MPIYEYECNACNKRTELLQKMSDPPLEKCPECEGDVRKVISSAGLHFKGSGWYVTDYAKKSKEPDASSKSDKSNKKNVPSPSKSDGGGKSAKGSKDA